jgi:hypothetical protein
MSIGSGIKFVAGAVALALAGAAAANTSIDATSTGNLFLNIVDNTNNTSFLYDTGISQATFNGGSSYSLNLANDANLKTFLNGSDSYDFSVISATVTGGAATLDFTGDPGAVPPSNPTAFNLTQAQTAVSLFLQFANTVSSTTTNSAVIPTGSANNGYWGQGNNEGIASRRLFNVTQPPYPDSTALGTALSFFQAVGSNLTTFTGSWNFSVANDVLSYAQNSGGGNPPPPAVPLPASALLLLSGLGLAGVTLRRRKAAG